ncbi:MAG: NADH-quinone oxidoreductase subunit C/D [Nitrospiraceae bacterium]|nr:NADH-quinone oxidoreductase subunit C/D [Nitrospiraceae bacterium]
MGTGNASVIDELKQKFGGQAIIPQETKDGVPTVWVENGLVHEVLQYLKTGSGSKKRFRMLYDLTAIDERVRKQREGQPESDFTVVYHLLSYDSNQDVRVKTAVREGASLRSITDIWPAANWYEREVWDMFGVRFDGHPHLRRILMPPTWQGHPLRKDHPARATEMGPFRLPEDKSMEEQEAMKFHPEDWGMVPPREDTDYMFLNLGPHHPGTHGLLRIILALDGEEIADSVVDIGFHHRGAEKMGERQSWHTFIPYTDRIDYLAGVLNNLPYVLAVEKLAGIEVPDRVKVIRVMLSELFRIESHLVWYGTFAQDLGALSPVFYTFYDREKMFEIIEAVCGGRMHPSWFRIGGVAQDLPKGWDGLIRNFLDWMPARMAEYDRIIMKNSLFKARTRGVGAYTLDEAIEWGVTGPNLRACDFEWDWRKKRPYSGYEWFEFDIPTAHVGDSYGRALVRVEEIRQSMRIVEQCMKNMPAGDYKSRHPLSTPPLKARAMQDIETLIDHFLNVSWGPVIPAGEAAVGIEGAKGNNTYYLISDGSTMSYRTRIRTPSFPHMQTLPMLAKGLTIPDLISILGSLDFILADVDR